MTRYIIKRILGAIPVLFIASIIVFSLIHFIPGDPIYLLLPDNATAEQEQAMRVLYGFDKPLVEQYFMWLGNILKGDLGISILNGQRVSELIAMKIGPTVMLSVSSLIASLIFAFPLGITAGMKPKGFLSKRFLPAYTAFGLAMPSFWLGILLLILLFGVTLGILPTTGYSPFTENPIKAIKYILLPAVTQAIPASVTYSNFIQSSVSTVKNSEYVTYAIAKGCKKSDIISKHIMKNAMIPVVTMAAINFGRSRPRGCLRPGRAA